MLRLADLLAVRINQVDSPGSCQAAAVKLLSCCCRWSSRSGDCRIAEPVFVLISIVSFPPHVNIQPCFLIVHSHSMRVLISGAGIAGPTLAWFLAKTGACVTVVEKSQSLLPHGQNVDISGSAITVIKKMGLLDEIRRFNTTEKGTQLVDPNGLHFARFPVKAGSTSSPTSEFEILRGDLAAILYDATKDHANVSYLFGTTIQEVVSNDDKFVNVKLSNGKVQEYDLLVAADGQWSKVRKQCFPPECVGVVDKGMYIAYWTAPRLPIDNDWWNIYLALKSRTISLRPDPHGTIRAAFSLMPCNHAQKQAWQDALKWQRIAGTAFEEGIRRCGLASTKALGDRCSSP